MRIFEHLLQLRNCYCSYLLKYIIMWFLGCKFACVLLVTIFVGLMRWWFLLVTSCSVKNKCIQGFGFYGLSMTYRLKFDNLLGLVMFDIGVWACVPSLYLWSLCLHWYGFWFDSIKINFGSIIWDENDIPLMWSW